MEYPDHYRETTPIVGEQAKRVREALEKHGCYTNDKARALFARILAKERKPCRSGKDS